MKKLKRSRLLPMLLSMILAVGTTPLGVFAYAEDSAVTDIAESGSSSSETSNATLSLPATEEATSSVSASNSSVDYTPVPYKVGIQQLNSGGSVGWNVWGGAEAPSVSGSDSIYAEIQSTSSSPYTIPIYSSEGGGVSFDHTFGNSSYPMNPGEKVIAWMVREINSSEVNGTFTSKPITLIVPSEGSYYIWSPSGVLTNSTITGSTVTSEVISSSSSSSNQGDSQNSEQQTIVAIEGGSLNPGENYYCQIANFKLLNSTYTSGDGVNASVAVDQGGSNFGAYNLNTGANEINIGGVIFKSTGNGNYVPSSIAAARFAIDNQGRVAFTDGQSRIAGEYTIVYYDAAGRVSYRRFTFPSGASIISGGVSGATLNMTMSIPGAGTSDNPLHLAMVIAYTPNGGTRQIFNAQEKSMIFGFNNKGKAVFAPFENAAPGIYELEYTGDDGNMHEIKITVN